MKLQQAFLAISTFIFTICFRQVSSVIHSQPHQNLAIPRDHHRAHNVLVPKVSLTQKGYIQFLRYVVDVPELTDYTFCIWVRSHNLTHSHPLLSYSKHEEERLIRVWISPSGTHINLEILGMPVFSLPVNLIENEWYHVCQSWDSFHAAWSLYINGKLQASGFAPKLKKLPIDSGGDLVVGQEYTDFDKGLDDGIEGDISGFNFVLASTFSNSNLNVNKHKYPVRPHYASNNLFKREIRTHRTMFDDPFFVSDKEFNQLMNPSKRQGLDEGLDFIAKQRLAPPLPLENYETVSYPPHIEQQSRTSYEPPLYAQYHQKPMSRHFVSKEMSLRDYIEKPLGLLLVELSSDCGYLRGAPLSGKGVLVSWTKTEVRVFGGAILKTVPPFCFKRG